MNNEHKYVSNIIWKNAQIETFYKKSENIPLTKYHIKNIQFYYNITYLPIVETVNEKYLF